MNNTSSTILSRLALGQPNRSPQPRRFNAALACVITAALFVSGCANFPQDYARFKSGVAADFHNLGTDLGLVAKDAGAALSAADAANLNLTNWVCAHYQLADADFHLAVTASNGLIPASAVANEGAIYNQLTGFCAGAPFSNMAGVAVQVLGNWNGWVNLFKQVKVNSPTLASAPTPAATTASR